MNGQKKEARDRVIEELQQQLKKTQEALEKANRRIEELEKRLDTSPTTKFDEPFSVDAEESRQEKRGKKKKRKSPKKRKGRITTAEKVAQAARTERVYPQGELMRLMLAQQLFTFVTGGSVAQPNGESSAMSGTNNEAERSLRGAANARKTGRTSKTTRGAKRRTVTESVLESLRVHLPTFTLSSILTEIERWSENGRSCFTELLEKLKLPPPKTSILDALFPPPPPSKA